MIGPLTSLAILDTASKSPGGTGGETGLNDVHLHPLQLPGDFHFLGAGHADACGLLAVAQSGV